MDAKNFRPTQLANTLADGKEDDAQTTNQPSGPGYPKSLYLVEPLVSGYDLRAAPQETEPAGICSLDLDEWIVPSLKSVPQGSLNLETDVVPVVKTKSKAKGVSKSKTKMKEKRKDVELPAPSPTPGDHNPATPRRHGVSFQHFVAEKLPNDLHST